MNPPGPGRAVSAVVGVILLGIVLGRLVLERTGAGLVLFLLALPLVFLLCAALLGIGRAALLLTLFSATALLVRVIIVDAGWFVLFVAPALGITAYVLANTIRAMRTSADRPG